VEDFHYQQFHTIFQIYYVIITADRKGIQRFWQHCCGWWWMQSECAEVSTRWE